LRVLIINPAPPANKPIQLDAVVCRCPGIRRKADERLPPIGLGYIASVLEKEGHLVELVDCAALNLQPEEMLNFIATNPDVVIGIVGPATSFHDVNYLSVFKDVPRVLCGPFPSLYPEAFLKENAVEYVIIGEPEVTARDLVNSLEENGEEKNIDGVAFIENNKVRIGKRRPLIKDLDNLPFPARHLLPNDKYYVAYSKYNPQTLVLSSRGCPFECIFCSTRTYYGRIWRARSPRNVLEELKEIKYRFRINDIQFWDDTFTLSKTRVMELCKLIIEEKLDIAWQCLSRVDTVDRELIKNMKKAGCYLTKYGIETGSQEIQKKIKKNVDLEKAKEIINITLDNQIDAGCYFMIGNYGETVETIKDTIKYALSISPSYASFNIAVPYPGSEFYEIVKNNITSDWTVFDGAHVVYTPPGVTEKEIYRLIVEAYRKFYFNPRFILKRISKIRSLEDLKKNLTGAKGILSFLIR